MKRKEKENERFTGNRRNMCRNSKQLNTNKAMDKKNWKTTRNLIINQRGTNYQVEAWSRDEKVSGCGTDKWSVSVLDRRDHEIVLILSKVHPLAQECCSSNWSRTLSSHKGDKGPTWSLEVPYISAQPMYQTSHQGKRTCDPEMR